MLRRVAAAVAIVAFVALIVAVFSGVKVTWLAAVYIGVIVTALLFERSRYRPDVDRTSGDWQPTGERFTDPTSGEKLEVFYNAQTGERDYRPYA